MSDSLRHYHDGTNVVVRDLPDVRRMRSRYDERVALGGLTAIEEGDGHVVLCDNVGGSVPGHDPAEDAVVRHGAEVWSDAPSSGVRGHGRAAFRGARLGRLDSRSWSERTDRAGSVAVERTLSTLTCRC